MPNLLNIKLAVDTLTENNETFNINATVGFTVRNDGESDCEVGYVGGGALFKVTQGTQREFNGFSGYTYSGKMFVKFLNGASNGYIEVIKGVVSTEESV